jgi:tRNA (guanine37-N1)-methyltransferase
MSGHHGHIDRWRRQQSLSLTAQLRPDLIATARDQQKLSPEDEACLAATARGGPFGKTGL